jgi:hypothetical protein
VLNDVIGLVLLALAIELVVKGHLDLPAVACFVGVGRSLNIIDDSLFAALVAVIILLAFGSGMALKWTTTADSPGGEALVTRINRWLTLGRD